MTSSPPRSVLRPRNLIFVFVAMALVYACGCPGSEALGVDVTKDVVYGQGYVSDAANPGDFTLKDLKLDIYRGKSKAASSPALLLIHGGTFEEGSKEKDEIVEYSNYFANRGFVCFAIDYRMQADKPPAPSFWGVAGLTSAAHAAFVDTKAAIRFVRANAGMYGIDPNRIAVLGESAGALCALTAAVTDEDDYRVDGAKFSMPGANNPGVSSAVQACIDLWGSADHVLVEFDSNDPPIMVLHGKDDDTFFTSFDAAKRIHYALELYDIPHEFYEIENEGHGAWDGTVNFKNVKTLCFEFLQDYLID